MNKYDFLIDYEIDNLKKWCNQYENKDKKGVFAEVYAFIKGLIYQSTWSDEKKVIYFNKLKDIKKNYY